MTNDPRATRTADDIAPRTPPRRARISALSLVAVLTSGALAAVAACTSSSNTSTSVGADGSTGEDGSTGDAGYTVTNCPNGGVPLPACTACIESTCPSQVPAINTACSSELQCGCQLGVDALACAVSPGCAAAANAAEAQCASCASACGIDAGLVATDSGSDGAVNPSPEAGVDAGNDAGNDAGEDAGNDAGEDAGTDAAAAGDATVGPYFVYAANDTTSGSISAYTYDPATANLTPLPGSPFAAGGNPQALCADPSSRFLYVASGYYVYGYGITATTGQLTNLAGSPYAAGTTATGVGVVLTDPLGRFLFATNSNLSQVFSFTLNATTGVLSPVGAGIDTGTSSLSDPAAMAVDSQGKWLYVGNYSDSTVALFAINGAATDGGAGVLSSVGTYDVGPSPRGMAVSPGRNYLYVAYGGLSESVVAGYTIDAATGALSGSPAFTMTADLDVPEAMTLDPLGRYLYVADNYGSEVTGFAIAANGTLTGLGAPFPGEAYPEAVAVDPTGANVFVANRGIGTSAQGSVSSYVIADGGTLTAASGSPFDAGGFTLAVTAVKTY